jgi:preprotein translocase subunit SecG
MYALITVLIIIVCLLIMLVVLVQNPKESGGMGSAFGGGGGSQVMGVQRTTDFLEKATWTLAITLFLLSLISAAFVPVGREQQQKSAIEDKINDQPAVPNVPNDAAPQGRGRQGGGGAGAGGGQAPGGGQPSRQPGGGQ